MTSENKPAPKIGLVSLGCPKALVDSERIVTQLRSEGYQIVGDYDGADAVVVNTCGFIDSAKQESLEAISEALVLTGRLSLLVVWVLMRLIYNRYQTPY